MRICPKCQSTYTDATLLFCLQDGASLEDSPGEKTEIFNADSFNTDPTEAFSIPTTIQQNAVRTESSGERETTANSEPTVVRNEPPEKQVTRGGIGFLTGVLAGAMIIGVVILIAAAIWLVPGMFGNSNQNTNAAVGEKKAFEVSRDAIIKITASSQRKADDGNLYFPENVLDNDDRTAWCEGVRGTGKGEWIKLEFSKPIEIDQLTIKPGYFKNATIWRKNNRVASVQLQFSNGQNRIFDFPDEMKTQKLNLNGVETSFVKITIREIHGGSSDVKDTLISEIGLTALR